MADIASVWPWPPSEFAAWEVEELMEWHARAVTRAEAMAEARRGRRG